LEDDPDEYPIVSEGEQQSEDQELQKIMQGQKEETTGGRTRRKAAPTDLKEK